MPPAYNPLCQQGVDHPGVTRFYPFPGSHRGVLLMSPCRIMDTENSCGYRSLVLPGTGKIPVRVYEGRIRFRLLRYCRALPMMPTTMETQKTVHDCRSLIEWAIREEITISVSLKTRLRSSLYHAKFLEVDSEQVILEAPPAKVMDPYDPVLEVLITFCHVPQVYSFTATWQGEKTFLRQDGLAVAGMAVSLPTKIQESQRTRYLAGRSRHRIFSRRRTHRIAT